VLTAQAKKRRSEEAKKRRRLSSRCGLAERRPAARARSASLDETTADVLVIVVVFVRFVVE
jgi:hypothetical protein